MTIAYATPTRDELARALGASADAAAAILSDIRVGARLRHAAETLHLDLDDALAAFEAVAAETPAGSEDPASTLTIEQERVLRAAGSLRETMPPLQARASFLTAAAAARQDTITVREAAGILGVTESRVRQRLANRTLLGVSTSAGWQLPRELVEADRSTPGLDRVLDAFPADAHPLAVRAFLDYPNVDLVIEDEPVTPITWLASGGDADVVRDLVVDAYRHS